MGGCRIHETFCSNVWLLDDPKVSWDDNTCKVIHKNCHLKGYDSDITHNTMTQNTIFGVVFVISSTSQPSKSLIEGTVEAKFDSR